MSELYGRWIILTKVVVFFKKKKELPSSITSLCILVVNKGAGGVIHRLLTSTKAAPQRGLLGQWDCLIWHDSTGSMLYVSKCTERTPSDPHMNHGLWVIMTCSRRLISSSCCTTLVGDADHGRAVHMLGWRAWGNLCTFHSICVAPKTV